MPVLRCRAMPTSQNGARGRHFSDENDRRGRFRGRKWLATGLETGKTGWKLRNARKTRKWGRNQPKTKGDCPRSEVRVPKRSICVNFRQRRAGRAYLQSIFGYQGAGGLENGEKWLENGNFSRDRKGWGLDPVFLCVSCFPALSGVLGLVGRLAGPERPAEAKKCRKTARNGLETAENRQNMPILSPTGRFWAVGRLEPQRVAHRGGI